MSWSKLERSMPLPENKAKGYTLIELLVVIAIIGFISTLSYPSFTSWLGTRNTNDAVTKIESAFRSISTQIQRGVYPFGQVHIKNTDNEMIITTRGMGQENFNQNRTTLNCSLDPAYWDNASINYYENEYASINLNPKSGTPPGEGAICFSKDGTYYSGSGGFASAGVPPVVDSALFVCSRKEALRLGASIICQVKVEDADELNPLVVPHFKNSKNFYNISWSIFGSIVAEKWNGSEWIERQ